MSAVLHESITPTVCSVGESTIVSNYETLCNKHNLIDDLIPVVNICVEHQGIASLRIPPSMVTYDVLDMNERYVALAIMEAYLNIDSENNLRSPNSNKFKVGHAERRFFYRYVGQGVIAEVKNNHSPYPLWQILIFGKEVTVDFRVINNSGGKEQCQQCTNHYYL